MNNKITKVNMISSNSLHRGIYEEVQGKLKEKGIELTAPAVRMRIKRESDPVAMELYAEILQQRISAHTQAAAKLSRVTKKLEKVS